MTVTGCVQDAATGPFDEATDLALLEVTGFAQAVDFSSFAATTGRAKSSSTTS